MLKTLTSTTSRRCLQVQPSTTTQRLLSTPRQPLSNEYVKEGDRASLKPERAEGTVSGTDSEVAQRSASYDPTKTSPESEMAATQEESQLKGSERNPLNVSAANKDVGGPRDPKEGGADRNAEKPGPSSRGWTKKNRVVNTDQRRSN